MRRLLVVLAVACAGGAIGYVAFIVAANCGIDLSLHH